MYILNRTNIELKSYFQKKLYAIGEGLYVRRGLGGAYPYPLLAACVIGVV